MTSLLEHLQRTFLRSKGYVVEGNQEFIWVNKLGETRTSNPQDLETIAREKITELPYTAGVAQMDGDGVSKGSYLISFTGLNHRICLDTTTKGAVLMIGHRGNPNPDEQQTKTYTAILQQYFK